MAALRRDLNMVVDSLRGRHPSPLVSRPRERKPSSSSAAAARRLRIVDVIHETDDAISILLEDPAGESIDFLPGQFFTFLVDLEGETLRRAYSASSSYLTPQRLRVTTKRVDGGRVSNYLNDQAAVGQTLRALGPSGSFTYEPDPDRRRHLVLIGGGSGITPLMAIARAAIEAERDSQVTLIYSSRSQADVIYRAELDALAAASDGRLQLHYLYGAKLAPAMLEPPLDQLSGPVYRYYVCGPDGMRAIARETLGRRGVDPGDIREERFSSPRLMQAQATTAQPVSLRVEGDERQITSNPGETILEAALRNDIELEHSCTMGGCGACIVKLASGAVAMEEPNCLTAAEGQAGYILACVAHPTEPTTVEVE